MRYRWWKTLSLLSLFLAGCEQSPPSPPFLHIGLFSPYTSLDPIYARDQVSVWLVQQIFRGLVRHDSALAIVPDLAQRWEISSDGLRYRFFLHPRIPYHGHPQRYVTASDIIYSWHRLASPKWSSPGSYLFRGLIRGWEAYQKGVCDTIAGLRALHDTLLEVELQAPYGPFLHLLTLPYAFVVLPEAAEAQGRAFGRAPVGCGEFAVEYHDPGRLLVLRRTFPAPPAAQKILFRWFPNRLWAWEALRRGEIDAFEGIDPALHYLLQRDSSWKAFAYQIETPQLGTEYLGLDTRPESPLGDPALRRALRWLIWRLPLTEVVYQGHATSAQTFLPPLLLAYIPTGDTSAPDSATLRRLRQVPLTLYAAPAFRELCEYLQLQLQKAGISVTLEYLMGPSLREFLSKGQIHFWKASWLADFPDGENFLILFESTQVAPAGPNTTRYANPTMDSLIAASRRLTEAQARKYLYARAESLLQCEVPVIPLYHGHSVWTLRHRVRNFPKSPLPVWLPLHAVELSPQELHDVHLSHAGISQKGL